MVVVAQCTRLRAEEVLALEWEDIDFENLSMKVVRAVVHGHVKTVRPITPRTNCCLIPILGGTPDLNTQVGVNVPEDDLTPEVIARLIRSTSGNLRLFTRLLTQVERVLSVNKAPQISVQIVEAARESLVIGQA